MIRRPVFAFLLIACAWPRLAAAQPQLSIEQLSAHAALVVRGRVASVTSQWDPAVRTIYTYAAVDVLDVWKGVPPGPRIVVKLLGGRVGSLELRIADQAQLRPGEDLALWLEVRPRDGTLYVAGLSAGVQRIADLSPQELAALHDIAAASPVASDERYVAVPPESDAAPYSLLPPEEGGPGRWHEVDSGDVIPVDLAPVPSGLGGGAAELAAAIDLWNSAGSNLRLAHTGTVSHRCGSEFRGDGRILVTFDHGCGEVRDDGTIVGVGGAYMTPIVRVINGISFNRIVQGVVILNDGAAAQSFLEHRGCFQDALAHNLGHAVGLGHSTTPSAMMWPDPQPTCTSGPSALHDDDIAGLRTIYPSHSPYVPPGAPSNLDAQIDGSTVTLSWTAPATGGTISTYVVEAGSDPGLTNLAHVATNSTTPGAVFAGVPAGVYYVRVRGRNAVGNGPASNEIFVNVNCPLPSPPRNLTFTKSGFNVSFTWQPPDSGPPPSSYVGVVGNEPGASNLLVVDLGSTTGVAGTGPRGTYYVRILSRNACGVSAPSNEVVVELP